jgi:hypothetical protein
MTVFLREFTGCCDVFKQISNKNNKETERAKRGSEALAACNGFSMVLKKAANTKSAAKARPDTRTRPRRAIG